MDSFSNISSRNNNLKNITFVFKESFTWKREPFTFTWNYNPLQIERIAATTRRSIQNKIRLQNRREKWKNYFILFVLMPITLALIYTALKDFRFGFRSLASTFQTKEVLAKKRLKEFVFYLNDGDLWLSYDHYYNAVFQYRKAHQLYPDSYQSNHRLVMGLAYQCEFESRGCKEGKERALCLLEQYPDKKSFRRYSNYFHKKAAHFGRL